MPQFAINLFIILLIAIGFYSFIIAPRQREFKQRQKLVMGLKIGEKVLTFGGIIGTVKAIDNEGGIVTVQVADNLDLQLVAAAITSRFDESVYAESAQKELSRDK